MIRPVLLHYELENAGLPVVSVRTGEPIADYSRELTAEEQATASAVIAAHDPNGHMPEELLMIYAKQQKVELLSLPNWATWTAQEAQDNVSLLITNGITQETAEAAIDNLAAGNINQLIAVLKPILKNIIRAIYGIDTILKAMAKCIVFIRDILKP